MRISERGWRVGAKVSKYSTQRQDSMHTKAPQKLFNATYKLFLYRHGDWSQKGGHKAETEMGCDGSPLCTIHGEKQVDI